MKCQEQITRPSQSPPLLGGVSGSFTLAFIMLFLSPGLSCYCDFATQHHQINHLFPHRPFASSIASTKSVSLTAFEVIYEIHSSNKHFQGTSLQGSGLWLWEYGDEQNRTRHLRRMDSTYFFCLLRQVGANTHLSKHLILF